MTTDLMQTTTALPHDIVADVQGGLAPKVPTAPWAEGPVRRVRIVRAPDGLQIRTQLTGRKQIRTVAYMSNRFRHARFGEAATEILRIGQEEVEVQFVDAVAQPFRIEVQIGTSWFAHIPDFANLRSSGERVLLDVKREWSDFGKAEGRRQTFLGQLGADILGWRYERKVLANAGSEVRRDNIEEIQSCRFVHVPAHLEIVASNHVARGGCTLGSLAAKLHPSNGRKLAYALMVRRIVDIDLESRLGDRSDCRAVPPLPSGMPSIRG